MSNIKELIGKTLVDIENFYEESDELYFICSDSSEYRMYHRQSCCEHVRLYEIDNDNVDTLLNTPILDAYEASNEAYDNEEYELDEDSYTWTFYTIRTMKGSVTLRWLGTSNGYYSEDVEFEKYK